MSNDIAASIPGTEKPGEFENLPFHERFKLRVGEILAIEAELRRAIEEADVATVATVDSPVMVPSMLAMAEPVIAQLLVVGIDGLTTSVVCMAEGRTPIAIQNIPSIRPDRVVFVDRRDLSPDAIGRTVAAITGPGRTRARGSPRRR